jgi:hypothetical protein
LLRPYAPPLARRPLFKELPMFRQSPSRVSPAALASVSLLTLALGLSAFPQVAAAWPTGQEETVTLDDFTTTAKDGNVITIKHAEFQGTNLTQEEVVKLLTPDTPPEEKTALMQKMKAGAISIPTIDVAVKKGGAIHIKDVAASDVDSGKVGKFSIASVDGGGTDTDGPISIKCGTIKVENADLTDVLASTNGPSQISPMSHLGYASVAGLDLVAPDKDPGPGASIHIALASFELRNNYEGETLKDGATSFKGLVLEPSKGSDFANNLAILGYTKLELSGNLGAHYDAGSKKFSLDDFTINGVNAGAFGVKANFENIEPALFGADASARMGAVAGGAISSIEFKFVNAGLVEKTVTYFSDQQKVSPEALKKQWSGTAGQMLPAVLGGDPSALKVAAEAQKFIAAPSSFTLTVKPKSGAFKFADAIGGAGDPMALLGTLDIVAVANK